jgi:hypothetical protein
MTVTALPTVLHDLEVTYIERVNQAVAEERFDLVDALAREYDRELARLQAA